MLLVFLKKIKILNVDKFLSKLNIKKNFEI